jgi:hypothetical protein
MSYRTDPSTVRANQDFTFFFTLKNDMEIGIDNINISFECPNNLTCPSYILMNLPSYGTQEITVPIKNDASGGLNQIKMSWKDGSYNMGVDANENPTSTPKILSSTFPILMHESAISQVNATTSLDFNRKNNFSVQLQATDLNNIRISLYSSCMAFESPIFYFPSINGSANISTSVFVNCAPGSADLSLTLQSDELTYQVPLGVFVQKTPQSNLDVEILSPSIQSSKDNVQISVSNNGAPAEKLYLSILSSPSVRSPDMLYMGDFSGERLEYMEIQAQETGDIPITIEARWIENHQSFTKTWQQIIKVKQSQPQNIPSSFYLAAAAVVILCIVWMTYSKTSIPFFKKG